MELRQIEKVLQDALETALDFKVWHVLFINVPFLALFDVSSVINAVLTGSCVGVLIRAKFNIWVNFFFSSCLVVPVFDGCSVDDPSKLNVILSSVSFVENRNSVKYQQFPQVECER